MTAGIWKSWWLRTFAAGMAGLLMALLFPPFEAGALVWMALVPLLVVVWTVEGRFRFLRGFGLGWVAGLVMFLISLHWLTEVSAVGWVALSVYLAVFPGLWAGWLAGMGNPWRVPSVETDGRIAEKIRRKTEQAPGGRGSMLWRESLSSLRFAAVAAGLWCGLEWLRGWLFTGFGWNTLGVAFHETPVMAQSADLLGAVALSFLPVFLQAVMVQTGRRLWRESRAGRLRPHPDFGVAAVLVALAFCYGVWRLAAEKRGEFISLRVLLVQLNIPQEAARRLWEPERIHLGYEEETLKALDEIAGEDVKRMADAAEDGEAVEMRSPDWVMWPESSLTGRVIRMDDGNWAMWEQNMETLARVREEGDFTLFMGLLEDEGAYFGEQLVMKENGRVWNSLVMVEPDGALQTFRKHHLVIFGEYIPLVEQLPWLKKIYEQQSGAQYGGAFAVGDSLEPLMTEVRGEKVGVIPSVCFEDTVPRLMRRFVRGGPQVIVNVTNDGWFKDSPAAAQHFANARFRSIELRRPTVRCGNSGVSAVIDTRGGTSAPDGVGRQELRDANGNHLTRGWLLAELRIPRKPTLSLYAVIGDWGVIGLGVMGLLLGRWRR